MRATRMTAWRGLVSAVRAVCSMAGTSTTAARSAAHVSRFSSPMRGSDSNGAWGGAAVRRSTDASPRYDRSPDPMSPASLVLTALLLVPGQGAPARPDDSRLAAESQRGKELMAAGRFAEAVPIYRALVSAQPGNPG